jgi:intein/homing endonuclease
MSNLGGQISYCLAADKHIVPTDKGLCRIDAALMGGTPDRGGSLRKIVDIVDNGVKECITVRLENGAEIVGTPDHKVLTVSHSGHFEWKRLSEIRTGDIAVRRIGDGIGPQVPPALPPLGKFRKDGRNGNVNYVAVPKVVTEECEFRGKSPANPR